MARFSTAGLITRAQTAMIIVQALAKAGEEEPQPEPETGVPAKLSVEAKDVLGIAKVQAACDRRLVSL
ncbi:MAG: hypothetical protein PWR31_1662 [Bacillota bacterium]|nr:hypothetical protein [Bacillota bacterium]